MSSGESETRTRILKETYRLMEERRGQGVWVADVAKAAGISRQAVYLHFGTRAELLIAAVRYADQERGLEVRLQRFRTLSDGIQALEEYVDFWGNYIPEIHGLAKALLQVRQTDEAARAAWDDRMAAMRYGCECVIGCLEKQGMLALEWRAQPDRAIDMLWSMLSVQTWEALVVDCGWSTSDYLIWMKTAARRAFVSV